jgi:CMP/dCMP kinase
VTEHVEADGERRSPNHVEADGERRAEPRRLRVAIDGPAGAGKGTAARGLAERLGYLLVDTGALYRVVALAARRAGLSWDDGAAVGALAQELAGHARIALESISAAGTSVAHDHAHAGLGGSGMRVRLDGEDVSAEIRAPEMSLGASRVSAVPEVRAALLAMQRQAGAGGGVVLEGRDIGTVVFPDAEVKFFLTAAAEIRARRRFDELVARGSTVSFEETLSDVIARDKADTERAVAPLRKADDAIVVDSGDRSPQEIVEEMARVVESRAVGG